MKRGGRVVSVSQGRIVSVDTWFENSGLRLFWCGGWNGGQYSTTIVYWG